MRKQRSSTRRHLLVSAGLLVMTALGCARHRPSVSPARAPANAPAAPDAQGAAAQGTTTVPRATPALDHANTLDESEFGQQPVGRVEELFIGRFPGVQVYNVNGQVQIRIRGASSFTASTEPLILVDGQPLTPGSGGLIGLNPRDIHKIEVLKDAISTAEFGVRGSNGVIKITTKRPP